MELLVGIALVTVGVLGLAGVGAIVVCFLRCQTMLRAVTAELLVAAMAGNPIERSAVAGGILRGLGPQRPKAPPPEPPSVERGARVTESIE